MPRALLDAYDSRANGLTFCVGSYGSRADNDLIAMIRAFGPRINFLHLRNVTIEAPRIFYEAEHLERRQRHGGDHRARSSPRKRGAPPKDAPMT